MARCKVPDDWFQNQFADTNEGRIAACRHAVFLYNQLREQTERYEQVLTDVLERLKLIPGVVLALDIDDILFPRGED